MATIQAGLLKCSQTLTVYCVVYNSYGLDTFVQCLPAFNAVLCLLFWLLKPSRGKRSCLVVSPGPLPQVEGVYRGYNSVILASTEDTQ